MDVVANSSKVSDETDESSKQRHVDKEPGVLGKRRLLLWYRD